MNPITHHGMSLARMKVDCRTGVTLICSMVPVSFSLTMLSAGRKPPSRSSRMMMMAGIMKFRYSSVGL